MAKDSENSAFEKDVIQKWFKKSKAEGTELNFAFGLAAKPDESGLIVHLRKPGKMMKKELLAEPAIKKACFGTLTVVDSDVLLKPTKPLKGIIKSLKIKLRSEGMGKYHPVLVDADGTVLDEEALPDDAGDDNDEEEESFDEEAAVDAFEEPIQPPEQALDTAALKARLIVVNGQIKALGAVAPASFSADLMAAAQSLKAAQTEACAEVLTRLEAALANSPTPTAAAADDDPAAKLKAVLTKRVAQIRALPDGPARAELGGLAKTAMQALESGDLAAGVAALKALAAQMPAAEKAPDPAPTPAAVDVLKIWRDAKESVDEGISKLQTALRGQNQPVLARIADMGLNGVTDGNQTALTKALFDYKAASAADRSTFAKALQAQVGTYAQFLGSDPVLSLVENNPFGIAVPIRSTLGTALRQIATACKAA
jgi:hypothetical protein